MNLKLNAKLKAKIVEQFKIGVPMWVLASYYDKSPEKIESVVRQALIKQAGANGEGARNEDRAATGTLPTPGENEGLERVVENGR